MKDAEESKMDKARVKWRDFSRKFKLDSHHAIERFAVAGGAFTLVGALVLGGGMVSAHNNSQTDLTTVAQYTGDFVTSRTGVDGEVTGVYGNQDRTRSLVMMKFDNPSDMSSNPRDYEAYITGINGDVGGGPTTVGQATVGSIVNFGATGYLGIFLEAPEGFSEQLLNITVRANNEMAMNTRSDTESVREDQDSTFTDHDQWRVVVNPSANQVQEISALETSGTPEVRALYTETAVREQELELRDGLNEALAGMNTQLNRIENYENAMATTSVRLGNDENVRMVPPVLPDEITGDSVSGLSASALQDALQTTPIDEIEGVGPKSRQAREIDDDVEELNTYRLSSEQTVAGGFNFNWRDATANEGYLSDVVPGDQEAFQYIMGISENANTSSSARDLEWPLTNNELLSDYSATDAAVKPLNDLRNNVVQAYDDYHKLKREYQATLLRDLLLLEVDVNSVVQNSNVVTGTDSVEFRL